MSHRAHVFGRILTVVLVLTMVRTAIAGPYVQKPGEILHINTPGDLHTDGGSDVRLLPGIYYDDRSFKTLDDEMRRLQEVETRLKAENKSLRGSAKSISFGWYALGTALAAGIATGYLLAR